ncbi:Uu.00g104950.m01.CDS01 [Anthostomella pinea]|uniref:Uu.00g104950.m01.CDS01 n=1 Tax=Anthostomella pinea TaxID=933095 RepID=A0AAI8YDC1_9PEZI|nr:Uu.00g104950.m01.CDS01 [Anthostomella pinea]
MRTVLFLVLQVLLVTSPVIATSCDDIRPLQLPIKDIQVLPKIPDSFMRGIQASIGTPPQDIVVLPWPSVIPYALIKTDPLPRLNRELNNTWIYDQQAYCDSTIIWNDLICDVRRGNLYEENNSSSSDKASDMVVAGGAHVETQGLGAELGIHNLLTSSLPVTEIITLESTQALLDFPVGIPRLNWDHGYTILHAMGMGTNSTVLNALVQSKQIGSRVWSIFWGRMWVDEASALDGSIVFGGFDQQKTIGHNYTQPLDFSDTTGCWTGMKVHISSITLNNNDGNDSDLLPPNTSIDTCIVPQRQLLLEAPHSVVDAFEEVTGMSNHGISYGLHWDAFLYDAEGSFDGDMTISFTSGLEIRVPNSQYLVPYVDIDRNGSRIFNNTERELLINGLVDQPATLGRYFLTAAYLMVDLDANSFTLWQANPASGSTLVSVTGAEAQCGNESISGTGSAGPADSAGSSSSPSPTPRLSEWGQFTSFVGLVGERSPNQCRSRLVIIHMAHYLIINIQVKRITYHLKSWMARNRFR